MTCLLMKNMLPIVSTIILPDEHCRKYAFASNRETSKCLIASREYSLGKVECKVQKNSSPPSPYMNFVTFASRFKSDMQTTLILPVILTT